MLQNHISEKQLTGPRTPEGKAAQNSRKHCFTPSTLSVVRLENLHDIAHIKDNLLAVIKPVNSQELFAGGAPSRRPPRIRPPASTRRSTAPASPNGFDAPFQSLERTHFGTANPMKTNMPWRKRTHFFIRLAAQNALISICYGNPLLHFPNYCLTLNLSDVECISNPIPAIRHRPTPCNHYYYYSGHRIRPRLRPLGRVPRPPAGINNPAGGLFYFVGLSI